MKESLFQIVNLVILKVVAFVLALKWYLELDQLSKHLFHQRCLDQAFSICLLLAVFFCTFSRLISRKIAKKYEDSSSCQINFRSALTICKLAFCRRLKSVVNTLVHGQKSTSQIAYLLYLFLQKPKRTKLTRLNIVFWTFKSS